MNAFIENRISFVQNVLIKVIQERPREGDIYPET